MPGQRLPDIDHELRHRLNRRYGSAIEPWLDALPALLRDLAERWGLEWGTVIQRGSMSAVIRCRFHERAAVLKVGPDTRRVAFEAKALGSWRTQHVPDVLAADEEAGALLIEAVEPGTPLDVSGVRSTEGLATLLTALHETGVAGSSFPTVADRVTQLFDSGRRLYERSVWLAELIPPELYERGRRSALRLAGDAAQPVLLHGDLTPVNVLDGGSRGLVAVDPAPCLGDAAFDAIDFVLWRAEDTEAIVARAQQLGSGTGADPARLLDWCASFAGMAALEVAENAGSFEPAEPLAALARSG